METAAVSIPTCDLPTAIAREQQPRALSESQKTLIEQTWKVVEDEIGLLKAGIILFKKYANYHCNKNHIKPWSIDQALGFLCVCAVQSTLYACPCMRTYDIINALQTFPCKHACVCSDTNAYQPIPSPIKCMCIIANKLAILT